MQHMLIMRATDETHQAYKDVDFNESIASKKRPWRGRSGRRWRARAARWRSGG